MYGTKLPNLELLQERFFNSISNELKVRKITNPTFEVVGVFLQTWGSTALGFGGIGGQAMTEAYTTVIHNYDTGYMAVFFSERLAYIVYHPNEKFIEDLRNRNMKPVYNSKSYNKAKEQ